MQLIISTEKSLTTCILDFAHRHKIRIVLISSHEFTGMSVDKYVEIPNGVNQNFRFDELFDAIFGHNIDEYDNQIILVDVVKHQCFDFIDNIKTIDCICDRENINIKLFGDITTCSLLDDIELKFEINSISFRICDDMGQWWKQYYAMHRLRNVVDGIDYSIPVTINLYNDYLVECKIPNCSHNSERLPQYIKKTNEMQFEMCIDLFVIKILFERHGNFHIISPLM